MGGGENKKEPKKFRVVQEKTQKRSYLYWASPSRSNCTVQYVYEYLLMLYYLMLHFRKKLFKILMKGREVILTTSKYKSIKLP